MQVLEPTIIKRTCTCTVKHTMYMYYTCTNTPVFFHSNCESCPSKSQTVAALYPVLEPGYKTKTAAAAGHWHQWMVSDAFWIPDPSISTIKSEWYPQLPTVPELPGQSQIWRLRPRSQNLPGLSRIFKDFQTGLGSQASWKATWLQQVWSNDFESKTSLRVHKYLFFCVLHDLRSSLTNWVWFTQWVRLKSQQVLFT